ncbi:PAS domain-containing sensor histidine kinase [Ktedonobacter racemifer]|uniref:histidine kinase n=1 Tax=Ktedonobacter racemifer DSM 44963 TaxID=485913 RepID=D6TQV9_KTERA|nr:PAS domain-containing sensor histidine kinase [Ktedonobacter racemifer]EFH85830.1 PAS/PAC sensor signal transduction histidine kinase [Ktedonobacter racemifer DSM 44963]
MCQINGFQQVEEELRLIVEKTPNLIWVATPDGSITFCNQSLADYTGLKCEQIMKENWLRFIHPGEQHAAAAAWKEAVQTDSVYEEEHRLGNGAGGTYHWFLVRVVPLKKVGGSTVKWLGVCTNIDEQKRLEKSLRVSEACFSALFQSNILGLTIGDSNGLIHDANEAFLSMLGYTRDELLNGTVRVEALTPPESHSLNKQIFRNLLETGVLSPIEKDHLSKDGNLVPTLVGAALLEGEQSQHIAFLLDMTERKELERRKDEFISIASHELKVPLTALTLLSSRLRKKLTGNDGFAAEQVLTRMEGQVRTLTRLINDLLDVSKIQMGKFDYADESLDLASLIHEVVAECQHATTTHTLEVHGALSGSFVGDRDRLSQVVTNLLTNAVKYSPQANRVDIHLSRSSGYARIHVQDYGVGIPKEQQQIIFERFNRGTYSRKERAFPGLGMGLYIAQEIVKHYQGEILVESEEGKGAIFTLSLPMAL